MPSVPKANLFDPAYLEHWRDLCRLWRAHCFVCGLRDATVVPHHVRAKRRFGDKSNIVPLCFRCHQLIHQQGASALEARHGVTLEEMREEAARLYAAYLEMRGE